MLCLVHTGRLANNSSNYMYLSSRLIWVTVSYIGDNILIVDSDTVWSCDVTFVNGTDGKVTYIGVDNLTPKCNGMDPVQFTEAITADPHLPTPP